MASQEELKDYLVGKTGYLKNSDNNSKVIMLSGKWGSGKTHFWQNLIATDGLKKELKDKREVYSYVSLYGKTSIEEIENDIFSQAYYSAIGGENFVTKGFSTFTKRMKRFGNSKIANGLKEEQKDNIERTALSRLNNGGLICFDDFERKSKDIDVNDLFGFITQLSLNFKCKVVIILNDDAFEGEEKDIFSNVKEKTVSKYLYYKPSIEELFNSIYNDEKKKDKYKKLDEYRELILKTIEETKELNARIYIQVLDNLLEWEENSIGKANNFIEYLILVNINFILNHNILYAYIKNEDKRGIEILKENEGSYEEEIKLSIQTKINLIDRLPSYLEHLDNIEYLKYDVGLREKKRAINQSNADNTEEIIKFIENNTSLIRSIIYFKGLDLKSLLKSNNNAECEIINKINNFIETGILIKESN